MTQPSSPLCGMPQADRRVDLRRIAPPGYSSTTAALLDLARFGPGLWTGKPSHFLVMLFHVERCAPYGKEADAHSTGQALDGIWSTKLGRWVRGPAGVAKSTYHSVSADLCRTGLLTRERRKLPNGQYLPTEYRVDWLALRNALRRYESQLAQQQAPLFTQLSLDPAPVNELKGGGSPIIGLPPVRLPDIQ